VPRTDRVFSAKDNLPEVVLDFAAALRFSRYRVLVTPKLRAWIPIPSFRWIHTSLIIDVRDILGHLCLVPFTIWNHRADLIVVQGFRTNMLALAMLGLWPFRRKLLFIIHHNLQWAHVRPHERILKLLFRMGLQFGLLEGEDGVAELGVKPHERRLVVLPLPVQLPHSLPRARRLPVKPTEIGVIGRDLREKNTDDLLRLLVRWRSQGQLQGRIILASDNMKLLQDWESEHVLAINTSKYDDYLKALARCDVALLSYDRNYYYYRSSGIINDAASLGTAVVCPNFPVFRRQVTEPVRVGALFDTTAGILPAISLALEVARTEPGNFELWAKHRRPEEFSRRIDAFIDRGRHSHAPCDGASPSTVDVSQKPVAEDRAGGA
jgi:hypothetical protein